ncbi:hypothetical protein ACFVYF_11345 [Streptomyces sp. NPDC058274]|uniref:hypothetical protein n=1 Tax=Streptomyces sp. NPDC058274 TaxID=3346416 RepID=UPI0036E9E09C
MSEIAGQTGRRVAAADVVHESYSFACMRCGHGWEQSYEIEHHLDAEGSEFVTYVADGRVVPSPLSRPTCQNCDNHVVRIMRAGQVSSVLNSMQRQQQRQDRQRRGVPRQPEEAGAEAEPGAPQEALTGAEAAALKEHHHWHFSDLLHPFHHRKAG